MWKKLQKFAAVAVLAAPLALGGCSEYVQRGLDFVSGALTRIKAEVQSACAQVAAAEVAAESAVVVVGAGCTKWHERVVRARKSIAAICTNLDKLDDAEIGNYVASVRAQLAAARDSKPPGC